VQTIYISPSRFIASGGKLDSNYLYLHKVASNGDLLFPLGKTIKLIAQASGFAYAYNFVYHVGSWKKARGGADSTFTAIVTEVKYK